MSFLVNTSENPLADFAICFWASPLREAWAGHEEAAGHGYHPGSRTHGLDGVGHTNKEL